MIKKIHVWKVWNSWMFICPCDGLKGIEYFFEAIVKKVDQHLREYHTT